MKNMKLGAKIAFGFGVLVLIAGILGVVGVVQMGTMETETTKLAEEYIPEVDMAVDLRGGANRMMYAMRGYGYTENPKYYEQAQQELQAVENSIEAGRQLDKKAKHLKALKGQLDIAAEAVDTYKGLMAQTKETVAKMNDDRKVLDESAEKYGANANDFLAGQNRAFKKDLAERQKKVEIVTGIVNLGTRMRVTNFKAQAQNDMALMQQAVDLIAGLNKYTEELRPITRDAGDIKGIDGIEAAAEKYGRNMAAYIETFNEMASADRKNYTKLDTIRGVMDEAAGQYVDRCETFLAGQQKKLANDMYERNTKISLVNDAINLVNDTRVKAFKSQALRSPAIMEDALKNFPKMGEKFGELRKITRLDVDLKRLEAVEAAGNAYKGAMVDFLENWKNLQALGGKRNDVGGNVIAACKTLANAGMDATTGIANETMALLKSASWIMIVGLVAAIVLGVLIGFFITRSITGPIKKIITGLNEGSDQVAAAAGEVSASSQSLAEGASEQAASIEETSASLEEISSMTKQNADNSSQADGLMGEANSAVGQANTSMSALTTQMEDISKASVETQKIIKTIDEVAFQTNLLALNAAVEAARAGEAGAGFAVVADEVRNLALRSAEAAKNTAVLIEGTVKKVNDGSELVEKTNAEFTRVAESAGKVGELISEISAASTEQAQGVEEVNKAVTEMDKVTQQNAANAEESASASEEMNAQAEEMKSYVSELVAMVGGETGQGTATHGPVRKKAPAAKRTVFGKAKALAAPARKKGDRPEDVIPLNDDDFSDF